MCDENSIDQVVCPTEAAEMKKCDIRTIERHCVRWSKMIPPKARKCGPGWIIDLKTIQEFSPRPKKIVDNVGTATLWDIMTNTRPAGFAKIYSFFTQTYWTQGKINQYEGWTRVLSQ